MGLMDKVKQGAGQALTKAQQGVNQGKAKLDQAQAKHQWDGSCATWAKLLRRATPGRPRGRGYRGFVGARRARGHPWHARRALDEPEGGADGQVSDDGWRMGDRPANSGRRIVAGDGCGATVIDHFVGRRAQVVPGEP